MPKLEIPLSQPKIVDVVAVLDAATSSIHGLKIRNGKHIWCVSSQDKIEMSREMAFELSRLTRTYRYFYRVMSLSPLEREGLTMSEWVRLKTDAEEACRELDRIYPGK